LSLFLVVVVVVFDLAKEHGGERAARDLVDLQVHEAGAQSEARQSTLSPAQVSASDTQVCPSLTRGQSRTVKLNDNDKIAQHCPG